MPLQRRLGQRGELEFGPGHPEVVVESSRTLPSTTAATATPFASYGYAKTCPQYLAAADGAFASLLRADDAKPWVVNKDSAGYFWIQKYPIDAPGTSDYTFNGMIFALFGVWDYYQHTHNELALKLWDGGLTTIANYYPRLRNTRWLSFYCNTHRIAPLSYHHHHLDLFMQLQWFSGHYWPGPRQGLTGRTPLSRARPVRYRLRRCTPERDEPIARPAGPVRGMLSPRWLEAARTSGCPPVPRPSAVAVLRPDDGVPCEQPPHTPSASLGRPVRSQWADRTHEPTADGPGAAPAAPPGDRSVRSARAEPTGRQPPRSAADPGDR
ncbi:D-glucuronyl C5-epimerase family protein [Streptomyces sp. NBC_01334]|uniref:D-glucuronyl C5-epimerase family protein n=1 Tax=Streptomyces sp. NBC_01334 TaxID=2903827 RepID=UPI002E113A73|nr:D-glucuronyl C5-epimerase family protein [Streptomyces sp. NBC_01334]